MPHGDGYFEALVHHTTDLVVVLDGDARIAWCSPSAVDILGHEPEDVIGHSCLAFVHPNDADLVLDRLGNAISGSPKMPVPIIVRCLHRQGHWRMLEIVSSNLLEDDTVGGIVLTGRDVTDRERSRIQTQMQAALLDQVPAAMLVCDQRGRITFWNKPAEELFGWSAEDVLGRSPHDVSLDPADTGVSVAAAIAAGVTYQGDHTAVRKDSTTVPIGVRVSPVFDCDGMPIGVTTVCVDLTERVQVEQVLAASEAWFRAVVQESSDVIFVLSAAGLCTYASPSAERVFGWPVEDYLGRRLDRGMTGTRYELAAWFERVRENPGFHAPEILELLRRDGTPVPAEIVATNLLDDPAIEGIVIIARDVSERLAADDRLALQARMLNEVPAAVVSTDMDGIVTSWNPYAERLFGWPPGDVIGRPLSETAMPVDRLTEPDGLLEDIARDGRAERELVAIHRDGHEVPVHTIVSVLRGHDGKPAGLLGMGVDITARRRAERELATRTAQQAAVAELGVRALTGADPGDLLQQAVDLAAATLEVAFAHVVDLPADGGDGTITVAAGYPTEVISPGRVSQRPGTWIGDLIASGQPAAITELETGPQLASQGRLQDGGVARGASAIIEGRERPLGVLSVFAIERRQFSADDLNFLRSLANVVAAALDRTRVAEEMRHQALHDSLTGLPNRTLLLDRLGHALARAGRRADEQVALLFIDLDRFKLVNDTFGHSAGDALLTETARRLERSVRAGDTVARFGGDEFAVLCEDIVENDETTQVAERIAEALSRPMAIDGRDVFLTASIGIAITAGGPADPEALLRDADVAMYRAKERGRSRWEVFDWAMRQRSVQRLEIEHALRRAITKGELRVEYQPLIALGTGDVVSLEALVRWDHPGRGQVEPAEFIPVAEETGLIGQIGAIVLEDACRNLARWRERHPALVVAVNLSPHQLTDPGLHDVISRVTASHGLALDSLALEITESVLLDDRDVVLETLRGLRAAGVEIALDDFGTGYSSLGYLTRFPVDSVKVDRSFVRDLGVDTGRTAIVAAVIGMAHALGLLAVGEGVEHERQVAELVRLGCDIGQGRYWSSPMPPADVDGWLCQR